MTRMLEQGPVHVVELDGTVDVLTAAQVRDTVLDFDSADTVVIDCHNAREVQDAALAYLAWSVWTHGRHVEFRGVCEHQLRLLRYLGFGRSEIHAAVPGGADGD